MAMSVEKLIKGIDIPKTEDLFIPFCYINIKDIGPIMWQDVKARRVGQHIVRSLLVYSNWGNESYRHYIGSWNFTIKIPEIAF